MAIITLEAVRMLRDRRGSIPFFEHDAEIAAVGEILECEMPAAVNLFFIDLRAQMV